MEFLLLLPDGVECWITFLTAFILWVGSWMIPRGCLWHCEEEKASDILRMEEEFLRHKNLQPNHWLSCPDFCSFWLKFVPVTSWRLMKEWRCVSTYYLPQHWIEVIGQLHEMSALISGKDSPVPIDRWDLVSHTRHHALCKEKWYRHFDRSFSSRCFFSHYGNICVILVQYLSYSAKSATMSGCCSHTWCSFFHLYTEDSRILLYVQIPVVHCFSRFLYKSL